ncbi:MAG: DUF58 domain-containing protein [candidate division Zixibacteria bacterium CG_4_9_14_3_um_filter_46_8]|nr:MAG: DUF58 domain-containing protein [candidate division Zixibacteria bacterium CG_4_9_14_3_um_filter_46_8]
MPDQRTDYLRFLQPDTVSRLRSLELRARLVVEGFIIGLHRSPYHGFSVEFAEHRQYMPGDSIKNIDWKVFGKTDRYYVKEFEEETNLKCYILLDCSASMRYSSGKITKFDYARQVAASLAYLMLKQQDAVGLLTYDEKIRRYIPPRMARPHLNVLLKEMDAATPSEKTDSGSAFHELAERIKRRGLVIIISDLLDDYEKLVSGMKHFRHKKHEVVIFRILDPREEDFNFPIEARFKDMETGEIISTDPHQIKEAYRHQFSQFSEGLKTEARRGLIDFNTFVTTDSYDKALFAYLARRAKLG